MNQHILLSRKELYDKVWNIPLTTLSKEYNLSDNGLRKICIKHNIPLPKAGHWSKLKHGKQISKNKLNGDLNEQITIYISPKVDSEINSNRSPYIDSKFFIDLSGLNLTVQTELINPDKITREAKKVLAKKKNSSCYRNNQEDVIYTDGNDNLPDIIVSKSNLDRTLRILDTLIKNFRLIGFKVYSGNEGLFVENKEGQRKSISFREKSYLKKVVEGVYNWERTIRIPNGKLLVRVDKSYSNLEFVDTDSMPVESKIDRILQKVSESFDREKKKKFEMELYWAERREVEEIQKIIDEMKAGELKKFINFYNEAHRWKKFMILKEFYEYKKSVTPDEMDWLEWAERKLDWYDPAKNFDDSLMEGVDKDTLEPIKKNWWK